MQTIAFRRLFGTTILLVTALCVGLYAAALIIVISSFSGSAEFPADCGIVFGAAVRRGGEPGPGISRRVATAADLYHKKYIRTLFMTGGAGEPGQASEAAVMRDVALELGVSADDIITEDQSRSTWENLLYTAPLTRDCTSIVAISDRYHLARIKFLAWLQGWTDLHTYPSAIRSTRNFEVRSVLRETTGMLYYGFAYWGYGL